MKLTLTLEADSTNIQALNMGRIVVDVDGINPAKSNSKAAENGYSLRVVDAPEQQTAGSPPPLTALTDMRPLQYRTYRGEGRRLAALTITSDERLW